MAIVKECKTAAGVTIKFNDAVYAGKSEEEKEKLRKDINRTISSQLLKKDDFKI